MRKEPVLNSELTNNHHQVIITSQLLTTNTHHHMSFDAFGPKKEIKGKAKAFPVLTTADQSLRSRVSRFIRESDELKALDASLTILKNEIKIAAVPFWLTEAKSRFVSTVEVPGAEEDSVKVTFKNDRRVSLPEDNFEAVQELLKEKFDELFVKKQDMGINLPSVPEAFVNPVLQKAVAVAAAKDKKQADAIRDALPTGRVAFVTEVMRLLSSLDVPTAKVISVNIDVNAIPEEKQKAFFDGVIEMANSMGLDPATLVEAKEKVIPVEDFNEKRAHLLSVDEALSLTNLYPVATQIVAK